MAQSFFSLSEQAPVITNVDDFFTLGCGRCERFATPDCSTRRWIDGLNELRRICREVGLVETAKWGHPCYMHADRNIALFGAFRDDFRMSFMNASLLKDPDSLLEKSGPNARTADTIRFADNGKPAEMEPVLVAYLREAMGYAAAGIKPEKVEHDLELPDELVEALASDLELAEAFENLTPGRQRSYVINLNSAKTSATRLARIAKFRDKILAGKGALDR